mgnify:CR=1 FL=1
MSNPLRKTLRPVKKLRAAPIQAALLGSALIFSPAIALYRHLSTQPSVAAEAIPAVAD